MSLRKIEELEELEELSNSLEEPMRSVPYEDYFGEMELTDEEKEERKELAERFEKEFVFVLALMEIMYKYSVSDWSSIKKQIKERYMVAIDGVIEMDEYVENYIDQFAENMIESSVDSMDKVYTMSYDRAVYNAENESNAMYGHKDLQDAIKAGKTRKQWVTMRDMKVRHTHAEVDRRTIAISDPFVVGDSLLLYPKDTSYSPEAKEVVNCRCVCRFY